MDKIETSEVVSVIQTIANSKLLSICVVAIVFVILLMILLLGKNIIPIFKNKNIKIGPVSIDSNTEPSEGQSTQIINNLAEEELTDLYRKIHVDKIASVTKACIESTINYINSKHEIFSNTLKLQIRKAEEITDEIVHNIKEQYSILLLEAHSEDPNYSIVYEPDYSKLSNFLKRDFKVSVDERLVDFFRKEVLSDKNDSEIDELSQSLSRAAISSLKEQLALYGLTNNSELLVIFNNSEQNLKYAISNAIRKGKLLSEQCQKNLKTECIRHNSEINRILQTSYDYTFTGNYTEEI